MTLTEYADAVINDMSDAQITERYQITPGELRSMRRKWGVAESGTMQGDRHGHYVPPAFTAEQYREWSEQGLKREEIGKMFGRSATWVTAQKRKLRREGVE